MLPKIKELPASNVPSSPWYNVRSYSIFVCYILISSTSIIMFSNVSLLYDVVFSLHQMKHNFEFFLLLSLF